MENKNMSRIKSLLFLLALAAQVTLASATVTYAVGSCKPTLKSFTTIMAALGATPAPNVVEVCPGTYPEQIEITIPVTLEGVTANNSTQAIITVPSGGLITNDVQLWVNNAGGEVNLTNLTVDATGYNGGTIGVYYTNSSGTMNHLTVRNQSWDGGGIGVWLQGGSANPSVTLENSNVMGFGSTGISIDTYSDTSALTATVKGNYVNTAPINGPPYPIGINFLGGGTVYITDNLITGGYQGIGVADQDLTFAAGSVSMNTVVNAAGLGIGTIPGGVSVTSNTIYNVLNDGDGISIDSSVAPVTGNTIMAAGLGIEFHCVAGSNVHSNTIQDTVDGVWDVPLAAAANTYYSVGTIRGTEDVGGCQ
jgi:hypothetical protein